MSSESYSYIDYFANISISSDFAIRKTTIFTMPPILKGARRRDGDVTAPELPRTLTTPDVDNVDGSHAATFFDTTQDLYLCQHVSFNTRFRIGCRPSRLDLIFSNEEHMVDNLQSNQPLGKSDHVVLTWAFDIGEVHVRARVKKRLRKQRLKNSDRKTATHSQ